MMFCSPSTCHVEPRLMALLIDASIIERLHSVIVEKGRGKASREVVLLHDNAPIHKYKIVQPAIRQVGFIELNHPTYFPDIALTNYHPLSNLKKFVRLKNFSSDDEAVSTIENYLTDLNSEFFCEDIQSLHDRWQCMVAAVRSVHLINTIIFYLQFNSI